jgi:hypothetical protein
VSGQRWWWLAVVAGNLVVAVSDCDSSDERGGCRLELNTISPPPPLPQHTHTTRTQTPGEFDNEVVQFQLASTGIFETVRIRRDG